jgi:hypothetical protein
LDLGFGIWDLGFGIWDLGFGIWDLGFGIWDLGFGIWDLGFGIKKSSNLNFKFLEKNYFFANSPISNYLTNSLNPQEREYK